MPVGTIRTFSFTVRDYTDLRIAVSNVQKLPFVACATELERSMIGTMVSELGSNIIKYATYGTIIASLYDEAGCQGVEILAKDDIGYTFVVLPSSAFTIIAQTSSSIVIDLSKEILLNRIVWHIPVLNFLKNFDFQYFQ